MQKLDRIEVAQEVFNRISSAYTGKTIDVWKITNYILALEKKLTDPERCVICEEETQKEIKKAKREVVEYIGFNQGWEETKEHYLKELGLL